MVMKKLIAISVVFALVAGTAFAEVNVGAAAFGKVEVLKGTNQEYNGGKPVHPDDKGEAQAVVQSGGGMGRLRIDASGQSDDGTFGGYIRLEGEGDSNWGNTTGWGNAWWKPIDQLKLLIGSQGYDGFFAADGVTRWGFYRDAGDVGIIPEGWAFGAAFYEGFTKGAILTITPLEALAINIGVPYFDGGWAEDVYKKTNAQVAYNIDGIGNLAITFVGNSNTFKIEAPATSAPKEYEEKEITIGGETIKVPVLKASDPNWAPGAQEFGTAAAPKLFAYFGLSAIENLGVDIGIGFALPVKEDFAGTTITRQNPIAAGLGVSFDADTFGIKVRIQGEFAGSVKPEKGDPINDPFVLIADILPSYAINDSAKVFLSAGLQLTVPDDKDADSVVGWHIQPYLTKAVGWCQSFYAGFRLESDGSKIYNKDSKEDGTKVNWAVPIGVTFQF